MKIIVVLFAIFPIVMFATVILSIIFAIKKKTDIANKILIIGMPISLISILAAIVCILLGKILIWLNDFLGYQFWYVMIVITIFIVWLIIFAIVKLKNKLMLIHNNENDIYIRDIEVKYSPAVLSYLMNNKIETKKDLPATLLNLCIKNIVKIEKVKDGQIDIIDLKNTEEINKLESDEQYAYEMLVSGVTSSKIITWKNKVKKEYQKYRFSKSNKLNLVKCFAVIWLIVGFSIPFVKNFFSIDDDILNKIMFTIIGSLLVLNIGLIIKYLIQGILKKQTNEFRDTYTKKGAIEYNRWKKFEKFINDFTLVKDKEYESIVILGKYLSYSIALGINKNCDSEIYKQIDRKYSFNYDDIEELYELE